MKLGLLLCDDVPQRFRHIAGGYREMFDALLRPHVPALEWRHYDVRGGELPAMHDECEAYVCTGSRYSVYDELPWIAQLNAFVRMLYETRTQYVGICFGHQVLAEALGGKVARAAQGWGIGVRDMQIVAHEDWMQPQMERCALQYMHGDQVQTLPAGSKVLACASHCEVALFRTGETMLGIEGHPEFPAEYERALLIARRQHIGAAHVDAALATLDTRTDDAAVGSWIARFIQRPC
jgi:GMP synthase-like glutamine amidotransferase